MNKIIKEALKIDKEYNALITLNNEFSHGNPVVVKDNICTKNIKTTAGSRILQDYIPPYDATVIEKLKKNNFEVLGKTAQDAFGFGSFSVNTFKVPKNPYDKNRVCGGSSGGTAAYIRLSKYVKYGLGQSTGGSINCPAAFCGVVGLTPTYGLVSRYGLIDYSNTFDRIGPITKSVEDAAYLLSIISGEDKKDMTTSAKNQDFTKFVGQSVKGIKLGLVKECFEGVDSRVKKSVLEAAKKLEKKGCELNYVSFPLQKYVVAVYYIIAMAEASTNLARYCGIRYGSEGELNEYYNDYFSKIRSLYFSKEEKRRILLGTFVRMAGFRGKYYIKALKVRNKIIREYKKLFEKFDVLITPTMPILPPLFDEIDKLNPVENYLIDSLTITPNLVGTPSLSVPTKKVENLPVGMQLIADHFKEENLIKVGHAYEKG